MIKAEQLLGFRSSVAALPVPEYLGYAGIHEADDGQDP
jgi:hypothetical protein